MSAYEDLLENDWFWYESQHDYHGKLLTLDEKKILMNSLPEKESIQIYGVYHHEIDKFARLIVRRLPRELEFHLSPIAGEIYTRSFDYILDAYMENHPGRFTKAKA